MALLSPKASNTKLDQCILCLEAVLVLQFSDVFRVDRRSSVAIILSNDLSSQYEKLFNTCEIRAQRQPAVDKLVALIGQNKERYRTAGGPLGVPWFFIGCIHNMEASLNFTCHLHNGDPL